MMDSEKLIEQLKYYGTTYAIGDNLGKEIDGSDELMLNAATALSTLQAENEKLRNEVERQRRSADDRKHLYENAERAYMKVVAELEQVKAERDAAVERIREWEKFDTYLFVHNFITPEKWRGPGKEN